MINKQEVTIGDRFKHSNKGNCTFTETSFALEMMSSDPTTLFVLFDGENEEKEISINLLEELNDVPNICTVCLKPVNDPISTICDSCAKNLAQKVGAKK